MTVIENVKVLLGIPKDDTEQDGLLSEIEQNTIDLFKAKTGEKNEVPSQFLFMVKEVIVKRYNRIGSEGMSSTSQTDLSMTFDNTDFDEYQEILDKYYATVNKDRIRQGKMIWL
ncbi:phage head-tail connector protein [Streptococcus porci]|uniref:phage head-tail connector protein n=1 Tax=Streptococcus porci TaxID=502567 RepID=UPI00040373CC|nr:phage head-tail connector protein [Streptococcus porci]